MIGSRESGKKIKKIKKEELGKYKIKAKGFTVVNEELKQKVSAKSQKLRCYRKRGNQYRQNNFFLCDQKALYQELGGKERSIQVPPNAEEMKKL